jgi:hypothetical protein
VGESTRDVGEARDADTKKEAAIIAVLTATLQEEQTIARYRVRAQDWSRQRTLTFRRVVILLLTGHKHALQKALKRFFRTLGLLREVPTASAYRQARQKVEPALFRYLTGLLWRSSLRSTRWKGE